MTDVQLDFLEQVADNAGPDWLDAFFAHVGLLAAKGVPFQAADVAAAGCPEPDHANRWGAALQMAARSGLIKHHGYAQSTRATTKHSLVRTWVGA